MEVKKEPMVASLNGNNYLASVLTNMCFPQLIEMLLKSRFKKRNNIWSIQLKVKAMDSPQTPQCVYCVGFLEKGSTTFSFTDQIWYCIVQSSFRPTYNRLMKTHIYTLKFR